jgi:hypothetical protein
MCAQGLVCVLRDVHSLCSKCECVFKDWYVCSRMYIVCVRGCDVFEDWYMCSRMWVYVLTDVHSCAQSVNVCSRIGMCSRIGICVQGCT